MDLSSAESEEYQAEVQVQEKADEDFLKSGRGRGADFSCRITVAVPNKRKRITRLVDRVVPLPGLRSYRGEDTVSILYTLTNPDGSLVRKAVCLLPADPAIVDAAFQKLQARGPGVTTLGRGQDGKESLQKVTSLDCGQYEYDPELGSCVLGQMYVEADRYNEEIVTWTSNGLENLTYYPPNEDEAGGGGGGGNSDSDNAVDENGVSKLPPDCSKDDLHPLEKAFCTGNKFDSEQIDTFRQAVERIRAKGGVCTELAHIGDLLLLAPDLRLRVASYATGLDGLGAGAPVGGNWIVIGRHWINNPSYVHSVPLPPYRITLQRMIAHELDHLYGNRHVKSPSGDVNQFLTPNMGACS